MVVIEGSSNTSWDTSLSANNKLSIVFQHKNKDEEMLRKEIPSCSSLL
jgi:hypothetical protein